MIPTLPEKYKCKEFAEKKEMKRSGQVIPFKFIFFVTNKVRLYDRSWVQEKQISRWIYEMHDLYRKSWCRRSWHLMGLNFCKANFCFISSAVVSVWVHYLKSPPKKEGKNTRNIWIMTSKTQIEFFRPKFLFLGNFFISTLSMTTSHLSFFLSNPLQRKMEKIRGMSE